MISHNRCIILFCFAIFCLGCRSGDSYIESNIDQTLYPEIIPITKNYELVKSSSDIFKNASIVSLKLPDNTLISGIDKILITDSSYFILDKKFTTVYKFDSEGYFQNRIGKLGVETGDYRSLEDIFIDTLQRIILLSNSDQSVFYYTPKNKFLKSIYLGFFNSSFAVLNPDRYLYYLSYNDNNKSGSYNFLLTDSLGSISKSYRHFSKIRSNMSIAFSGFLGSDGEEVLCTDAFNDTIYTITPFNNIGSKYYVDFGKFSLKNIREDHKKIFHSQILLKNNIGYLGDKMTFNANYMAFTYNFQHRINYCIYNRKTKQIFRINKSIDDGIFKLIDYPLLITKTNRCYFAISPDNVIRLKEKNKDLYMKIRGQWPNIYRCLEKVKLPDNYFLLSFDLK